MLHSMSGIVPTIGGSGILAQNTVRTGQQQSGVLGEWSGHLTWDRPSSARIGILNAATSAYYVPKDIQVNFTSTGNSQPVDKIGWNISPYPDVPGANHMYEPWWDMRDPGSVFDIYRLHITSMTASVTSNNVAALVGYQYYDNEPTFTYQGESFIYVSPWSNSVYTESYTHNCRYSGNVTPFFATEGQSGTVSSKSFSSTSSIDVRLTWGASLAYTYPAGTMNWSGTAFPVLDPNYHHVQPEQSSTYTWLDLNVNGYIERIPMPSAYK